MLDLKLFSDLQGDSTASLILKPGAPGYLQFFVISASVNHSIVVSGECEGELPSQAPRSFDVVLSTISPLLNKNYQFRLSYLGGVLRFVEVNDKFSIEPLCVEHVNDSTLAIVQKYLDFVDKYEEYADASDQIEEATRELESLRNEYHNAQIMYFSGGPSYNPWGLPEELDNTVVDKKYLPLIENAEGKLKGLQSSASVLTELDLSEFKRIATIAMRNNATVAMCDTFAIVNLSTVFVVQKATCGVRSIQGKLLRRLLSESNGKFFEYESGLVFVNTVGKGKDRAHTVVFLSSYLPNVAVDSSIVTKGAVQEKYKLKLKGMLSVLSAISSKFDVMVFDMGSSEVKLSNDRGEQLVYKFDVEDARTIELNKALRGEVAGDIVMSSIEIPKEVQRLLPMLESDFTVYVKSRKIVLQSGTLYVVFGR